MLSINKKMEYALNALYYMIEKGKNSPCSVKEISAGMEIPEKFLFHILKSLEKARIVFSKKGPKGGYVLLKSAKEINFKEVVEAVEGQIDLVDCTKGENMCPRQKKCPFSPAWNSIKRKVENIFEEMTLDKVLNENQKRKK
jgi:Rrf2 family protein